MLTPAEAREEDTAARVATLASCLALLALGVITWRRDLGDALARVADRVERDLAA